ncbi:hypothetical protein EZV62_007121 [Acer yangbiense]|uniref:F-box domain-containing protein n=1 Tax=Acer yangbiense TaxID=1000413 RepID=A0A5C7IBQ4_9ROSI|nr:hypothetical protein EZV62_007121 [Acer yangbiense]
MGNWFDLPIDILNSIVECLHYTDHIQFRAVCKSWRSNIYNHIKFADNLPWVMGYEATYQRTRIKSSSFYLYDPSQKRRYHVETKIPAGTKLYASKFGCLLLSNNTKIWSDSYSFFFYCPFTGEIIQLPELEMNCRLNQATFSTAPTSSDCVIFVFHKHWDEEYNHVADKFCVSTCSPGDTAWSNIWFNGRYRRWISSVAYSKGVFYCAFQMRLWLFPIIAAYNPALQEWKKYQCPPFIRRLNHHHECPDDEYCEYRDVELIDSPDDNGNLLLSYRYGKGFVCVFRFDQSQMEWFRIENFMSNSLYNEYQQFKSENLNNRVLFCSTVINNISLPAVEGEASKLASTIHRCKYHRRCISSGGKDQSYPQIYDWVGQRWPTHWWNFDLPDLNSDAIVWIQPRHSQIL